MTFRTVRITLLAVVAVLIWTGSALAATPAQIQRDAADGSIDGDYTLAEMRAADRSVSAEQREYYGWEDVYNAYIRTLSSGDKGKDTVVPAVPVDSDKDGQIEPEEQAAAKAKTKAKCTKASTKARTSSVCAAVGVSPSTIVDNDEAEPRDDDNKPAVSKDDDEDNGSPLIWLIVGIPLLIVLVGAWRFMRTRRGPKDEFPA